MKVLIADKFETSGIEGLKALGCEVVFQPDLKEKALADAIAETRADVLVVRSTQVTKDMFERGNLSLVVRAGAGYNTIDVKAASKKGIYVSNCPGKNSVAVAELALGMMIALDRRIPDNVAELRAGKWNKKEYSKSRGLAGKTLGLLGFGNIGQEVAKRAQAFGMNLVLWSEIGISVGSDGLPGDLPLLLKFRPAGGPLVEPRIEIAKTPAEVAAKCDVLSVHLAANAKTKGLLNWDVLGQMKPGSYFINTARGDVVDYAALERAVKEKNIRVALDVYAKEPSSATGEFSDPILSLPNVYGTHHIGASTDQAQEAIAAETVRIVKVYLESGRVPNVVNLCQRLPATHSLVVKGNNRPGVMADVFAKLKEAGINAEGIETVMFDGAETAVASINLGAAPSQSVLDGITSANKDIFSLHVVKLGNA